MRFSYLTLLLLLLLLWQVASAQGSRPPRLNVSDEIAFRKSDGYFSLRCEGTDELHWNWTTTLPPDDEILTISHETHPDTDYPYVSTFTITYPEVVDTGSYYCLYSDAGNYATDKEKVAQTYVYVYDGETGLVDSDMAPIKITTADKLVINCRTTLPNITVNLWKDSVLVEGDERRRSFDPRIGFVYSSVVVQDTGWYKCQSSLNDSVMRYIEIMTSSLGTLPKPAIEKDVNQHFVQGRGFRLDCSLISAKTVMFRWDLPNESAAYNITPPTILHKESEYQTSTLYVYSATLKDSGVYTCTVRASGSESNQESITIEVQETLESYINITGVSKIKINEGESLKWRTDIRAFPSDPEIIYRDWRGFEIKETERVTTEYHKGSPLSWLKIKNVTADDFGKYVVEGITSLNKRDSATVHVEVKNFPWDQYCFADRDASGCADHIAEIILAGMESCTKSFSPQSWFDRSCSDACRIRDGKPYALLGGTPSFVAVWHQLEITCQAKGFPLPTVSWTFKACPDGLQNCSDSFTRLQVGDSEFSTPDPGNIKNVTITYLPQESGILRCNTENEYGTSNTSTEVRISDIGGTFVFRHQGQNETNVVLRKTRMINVIVNDDFSIMCGAIKFDYKKVELTFSGFNSTDQFIHRNETEFSRLNHIRKERVTTDLQGTYICKVEPYGDLRPVQKEMIITVLDEKPVQYMEDANMRVEGQIVDVEENKPFNLNCTVSGTPDPIVTWFKDDEVLAPDSPFFDETTTLADNHQRLELKYVFKEKHVGKYSCRAENRLGRLVGFLTLAVPRTGLSSGAKVGLSFACLGIAVLVLMVIVLVKKVKQERKFRKSFRKNELYLFEKGNIGQLNPDCTADEQAELLPYSQEWEVPREDIKIGKQLGSGAFGRVVKATVSGLEEDGIPITTAALKMCKSQADQSQVRALALELKIMIHLGKHLNIVNLLGANTVHIGKGELWILVEYCRFGNLLVFMHRHRKRFINQVDPVTGQIDHSKLTIDPTSPLSPVSHSMREGFHTAPVTDQDGYLAPSSKFNLEAPPQKRHTASPPQSPTSLTSSSNSSYRPGAHPRQHVHNPIYNVGLMRSVSDCPEGGQGTSSSSSSTGGSQISHPKATRLQSAGSNAHSDNGSIGYCRDGMQTVNTSMTTAHSMQSPLSPSPMSPTDSTHISDMGLDSQGKPFTYEIGNIPGVNAPFSTSDLVCWAWQVAQGMDYLMRRKVLHGDLAARNLLLADDNVVKISDFGLSRDMYKNDVYMKKGDDLMPIKWMSVEAIRDRIFSVQSDVWAFGVTLWELFSLGSTPYPGTEVNKDFLQLLEKGHRMDRPKYANQNIYDLLLQCWDSEPKNRPSFSQAAEHLGTLMLPDLRGQYMSMNDPYLRMNEERFQRETDYLDMLSSPDFENLQRDDDETRAHYVNVQDLNDGDRENNYLNMKSPDLVEYSRASMTSEANHSSENYLPMNSTRGSPSPMHDVFSPRPNEATRFTFAQSQENPSRLTELPEEEEQTPSDPCKDANDQCSENSSLINSGSREIADDNLSKHSRTLSLNRKSKKEHEAVGMDEHKGEVSYVNLPSPNPDYSNV